MSKIWYQIFLFSIQNYWKDLEQHSSELFFGWEVETFSAFVVDFLAFERAMKQMLKVWYLQLFAIQFKPL